MSGLHEVEMYGHPSSGSGIIYLMNMHLEGMAVSFVHANALCMAA